MMINFEKKTVPQPQRAPDAGEENRFKQIRKAAEDGHRRAEADRTVRNLRQTDENDGLL